MNEVIRPHDFDALSQYCTKCGVARNLAAELLTFHCLATDNVAGISHRIAHKRIAEALEAKHGS